MRRRGTSIHLLAYLPDPADADLVAELERARRQPRHPARPDGRADGGRRHPRHGGVGARRGRGGATAGAAAHRRRAGRPPGSSPTATRRSREWLGNDSPYYVSHYAPDPVRAVELVRAAGGVPVIAHPWSRHAGARGERRAASRSWPPPGSPGSRSTTATTARMPCATSARLARSLGLLATGSSDYHGTGKLNRLGENTTDPDGAGGDRGAGDAADVPWWSRERCDLKLFVVGFVTLLVIMDPPGAIPIFLALTASLTQKQQVGRRPAGLAGGARGDRVVRGVRPADPRLPAHLAAGAAGRRWPAAAARRAASC